MPFGIQDLDLQIVGKLLLALILGGAVGLEREIRRKPAGLRTNILICVGSALFTVISYVAAEKFGGDRVRIAAQIIPGIGFIGAGAVLRDRVSVIGLTTAATIYIVASIGMAVGAGLYWTATFAAILVILALTLLGRLEVRFEMKEQFVTFRVDLKDGVDTLKRVQEVLTQLNIPMVRSNTHRTPSGTIMEFDAKISYQSQHAITNRLAEMDIHSDCMPSEFQHA
ncbi:MAG: MgtC/SapB family protein [Candidatus Acidiferrales bacterium]